jgi:hypothetical protein
LPNNPSEIDIVFLHFIFSATVTNLQTRVETLTTTNALQKEDLAISKNTILSLQNENHMLKLRLEQYTGAAGGGDGENVPLALKPGEGESPPQRDSVGLGLGTTSKKMKSTEELSYEPMSQIPANLSVTDLSKKLHDERTFRSEMEKEMETQVPNWSIEYTIYR